MITNIQEFCQLFYYTTSIPINYYNISTKQECSFPAILEDKLIFKGTLLNSGDFSKNPDYFVTPSFSYFGYVKTQNADDVILVGPIFSTPSSDFTLHNFMKEWAVSPEYREEIAQFLANTPSVSFNRFLQTLAYLYLCLNDEHIDIYRHFHLNDTKLINGFSQLHSNLVYESKENQNYHNTYHFEQEQMRLIQNGDTEGLKALLNTSSGLLAGTMADNALRQEKNTFIASVALVTRSAIAGGMDMEQAYQLSDIYIQECERSQSISHIVKLENNMLVDFTDRVANSKIPQGMSQEIFRCVQFITQNINAPIQVSDVADHIGKSRSYLCSKFKKELGFDISRFIMRCKLEEAKSLLTHSDKTLSEISNYLCFSSQSYFQNVFKQKFGLTPKQYRDKTKLTSNT